MSTNLRKKDKRVRASIKRDRVNPSDMMKYNYLFSCENCTHFSSTGEGSCTLGYHTIHHRYDEQMKAYNMSGSMAFCRFHEID